MESVIQFPSYVIIAKWGLPQVGVIMPTHWMIAAHRDDPNDTNLMSLIVLTDDDLAQKEWSEDTNRILLPVRNMDELCILIEGLYHQGVKLVAFDPGEKFAHAVPSLDFLRRQGWKTDLLDQSPEKPS